MATPAIGLTTFLLKTNKVSEFKKLFPPDHSNAIPLAPPLSGYFIPFQSAGGEPTWVGQVKSVIQQPLGGTLTSQSPGGILYVVQGASHFVLTFGHAWQKLEDDWLERDFGRRAALNSIAQDGIIELRAEQVFAKWHIASDRAPKASSVDDFGVEFDRDLVASVEGVPSDRKLLGKVVRGGTSFRVTVPISTLPKLLDKASKLFASDEYRTRWPEIDNLSPIRDQSLIVKLEKELDTSFAISKQLNQMVLFTPAFRRDEAIDVTSYVYGRLTKDAPTRPYLTIGSWVDHLKRLNEVATVAAAKSTKVHLLNANAEELKDCSVFDCLGCELNLSGRTYVLSSGVWYEAALDFVRKMNKAVSELKAPSVTLPIWNQTDDEASYNTACASKPGFLGFDIKMTYFGGGQSRFEFCDTLHLKSRTMYFAKIASKSSGMSHLLEQVRRTSELCFSIDGAFREKLKKTFAKYHAAADTSWLDERPLASNWNLCLVSLGRSAESLPFFAKCGLVKLTRELTLRGHTVSFLKV